MPDRIQNSQKDLLLVKPLKNSPAVQTVPPLGLGFISSHLTNKGFKVDIVDCNIGEITPEGFPSKVDISQYMVIGFQIFTIDIQRVKLYIEEIRKHNSEVIICIGGVQPSSDPEETMRYLDKVDFGVFGEAESVLEQVIARLRQGVDINYDNYSDIPNLILRHDGGIRLTHQVFEEDLDMIGAPDWEALVPENYFSQGTAHGFFFRKERVLPIIITRGCPYKCTFCGGRKITGFKVRSRSPENVINELKHLKQKYALEEFQVIDDNFTAGKKNAMEFCRRLRQEDMGLIWTCPNGIRLDTLDEELVQAMKDSGCYEVSVGIESGSQKILDDMNKKLSTETIKEKIGLLDKVGLSVIGFVMVGYPTDTEETIIESMKFVLGLPLKRISLTRFVPLPGTPITNELISRGVLGKADISADQMTYDRFSYAPEGVPLDKLKKLYRHFFFRFYLRPHIIYYNLMAVRSGKHLKNLFMKAIKYIQ